MSAHNAIDDLFCRLAYIDAEIWQCEQVQALGQEQPRPANRIVALEEQREAPLREAELRLLIRPRTQPDLSPSSRVAVAPHR